VSKSVATIFLALIILNGCLGIFIAIYPSVKHPTDAKRERYLLRGILIIAVGSISLLLLRSDVINVWIALLSVSFLLMPGEYLLAAREKGQLIRKGLYDPAELENRERQEWQQVKAKGQWRYVWEQVIIYGVGGFVLIAALNISMSEWLPFYLWIAGGLFAAFCGGVAALEKWKRQKH
jgi:predicted tellurium resistance membrane protein TerC